MNLIIDIGNTRTKAALFENNNMRGFSFFENSNFHLQLEQAFDLNKVSKCIVSSVAEKNDGLNDLLKKNIATIINYSSSTAIPVKNLYRSSGTLGNDRIPPVLAAYEQHAGMPVLVVDAGTCVKYNFINNRGEFIGGAISPGLNMRFKALNNFTARLPLIDPDHSFNELIGTDTKSAILSGVQTGIVNEIDLTIMQYADLHPGVKVYLTGGDCEFLAKRLKNRIFADPYLVLKGLNIILEFNTKEL